MKKVLVLAAALTLFATPALAVIAGSSHDLSGAGGGTDEICVYCHTPHGGLTGGIAPLWNRAATATSVATSVYTSSTLTATAAATVVGDLNATDAPLCLTCHDGASMTTPLINEPNGATMTYAGLGNIAAGSLAIIGDAANLSNDHPIGFNYAAAQAQDSTGLNTAGSVIAVAGMEDALSYNAGDMWCSSCHDVHDDAVNPFLRITNAGSALCLTCHNK